MELYGITVGADIEDKDGDMERLDNCWSKINLGGDGAMKIINAQWGKKCYSNRPKKKKISMGCGNSKNSIKILANINNIIITFDIFPVRVILHDIKDKNYQNYFDVIGVFFGINLVNLKEVRVSHILKISSSYDALIDRISKDSQVELVSYRSESTPISVKISGTKIHLMNFDSLQKFKHPILGNRDYGNMGQSLYLVQTSNREEAEIVRNILENYQ